MNAKEFFMEYANGYDLSDGMISLKVIHTMAVAEVMEELTAMLGLSERIREIAEICAVFHDIGRFEQVTRYHTFLDHLSRDHADLGCEVLQQEKFLEELSLSEREKEQVIIAIRNHNKYAIEAGLDEETLLLCKLIRDADKCDIFRVFACENMVDTMGETYEQVQQESITKEVYDCIFQHRSVPKTIRRTGLDKWIGFLGFFFDIYFNESLQILQEKKYYLQPFMRAEFSSAETRQRVKDILEEVDTYIHGRLIVL